jgi:hypothetical protein
MEIAFAGFVVSHLAKNTGSGNATSRDGPDHSGAGPGHALEKPSAVNSVVIVIMHYVIMLYVFSRHMSPLSKLKFLSDFLQNQNSGHLFLPIPGFLNLEFWRLRDAGCTPRVAQCKRQTIAGKEYQWSAC